MSAPSPTPLPSVSPAEMQVLVSRTGLTLNAGQMADLVLAWRQLAGLIAGIPHERPMADDQAYVFRLPAPRAHAKPNRPAAKAPAKKASGNKAPAKKAPGKKAPAKQAKPVARKSAAKRKR